MSKEEIIVDEQALIASSDSIYEFCQNCRANFEETIRKIKLNNSEWDDEDYNRLLSAINSFMAEVDGIDEASTAINGRIDEKVQAIHELHSMKI